MDIHHEINDVGPNSLAHMVGQNSVKVQIAVALEAAFADTQPMDSALLVGPPGLGKSMAASVIAAEMGCLDDYQEILGQSITYPSDLYAVLLAAKERSVLHIDECHLLKKEYQTALYLAIDKKTIFTPGGSVGGTPQAVPIANFTLLMSTTDEYCLLQPLRERAKLTLRFEYYSEEELTELTRQRSRALGWELEAEILPLIATRSKGTPRLALRLLQSCRRVCRACNQMLITVEHLNRACELEQLDDLGLGVTEQQYLKMLVNGPTRLNVLAAVLNLPARTISHVAEPFLLRAGLIWKDEHSRRQLTAEGREHLAANQPSCIKGASNE
jgi:Holliday junction DNA helicase RuvB